MSDPKLKEAMAEIFGILKKHDIAGQVVLVSPTHAEFRAHISPSWSCAFFEDKGGIRFRAKEAEMGSKEAVHKAKEETLAMFCHFRDVMGSTFLTTQKLLDQVGKQVEFEHVPFHGFEPHREN